MDFPLYCKDALALHQAWMQMGFDSKDIFVLAQPGEILVQLRVDGLEFTVSCGAQGLLPETILDAWVLACSSYNGMPQYWREANFQRWRGEFDTVNMVHAMVVKGIYRPSERRVGVAG
jgi:hypothetical protein